ncbi:uncharacterized protein ASCRUDRAFT_8921 [Ascoidea rubescens DSM 1968]|uniref:DNA mismatch repair protein HSM3 C-terminal domain-containing protein n=1 Tax=Ascoidea rubescens DSM 1968 TaxID=1344418 RepID=A0A1D2VEW8_9ASCO|nr:hypothetical protein ASCRUDRAFT_8921 [Ascoidea rubescens DSM 1968]ODV60165.1 hypothetical protein ASCRUDRAFT_8921 [Ascoidea rubescens DSM 1968]
MFTYSLESPIIVKFLNHLDDLYNDTIHGLDESLTLDISIVLKYDNSIYSIPSSNDTNDDNNNGNSNEHDIDLTNVSPIIEKILKLLEKDRSLLFYFKIDPNLKLIDILKAIFSRLSINQLNSIFDINQLVLVLNTVRIPDFASLAIKIIQVDYNNNSELIDQDILFHLISILNSNQKIDYEYINSIINSFKGYFINNNNSNPDKNGLSKIYNKLLSDKKIISIFNQMKTSSSTLIISRYFEIILVLTEYLPQNELSIQNKLISEFDQFYYIDLKLYLTDFLFLANIIKFQTDLLNFINQDSLKFDWLLTILKKNNLIHEIIKVWIKRNEIPDLNWIINEFILYLSALSYINNASLINEFYPVYSNNQNFVDKNNSFYLSNINPEFLLTLNSQNVIRLNSLSLNNKSSVIFCNLVNNINSFNFIKSIFTDSNLNNLQLFELYELLLVMSSFTYSSQFLFTDIPSIINNKLLMNDRNNIDENIVISDANLQKMRLKILSNLIEKQKDKIEYMGFKSKLITLHKELVSISSKPQFVKAGIKDTTM